MIFVTRLNGKELVVNLDQVVFVEATPDTRLSLATGERLMVQESVNEVLRRAAEFRRRCMPLTPRGDEAQEVPSWISQP